MSWFRTDDTFAGHKKPRRAGLAAVGLWAVAGSWSSQQLTEGHVPPWYPDTWPQGRKLAAALVEADLWHEPGHDCPECPQIAEGWVFHDWLQANPSAEQEKLRRKAAADRQRRARDRAKSRRDTVDGHAVTDDAVTRDVTRESLRESRSPRPDPYQEELSTDSSSKPRKRGTRIPDDFALTDEMVAWGRANAPHVDGRAETAKFLDYWRSQPGQRGVKLDWLATWRNWIRNAEERQPRLRAVGSDLGSDAHFDRAMQRAQQRENGDHP